MHQPKFKGLSIILECVNSQTVTLFTICLINMQTLQHVDGQSDCLRCEDFNKVNKYRNDCADSYEDCGECMPGFILDADDNRLCYALEIVESADDMAKSIREKAYLPCKFNAKIDCYWTKDGQGVDMTERRSWTHGNGEKTEDCSINIAQITDDDVGSWICSNKADSNVNSVQTKPARLLIKSNIVTQPEFNFKATKNGENVQLSCIFDHPVTCHWFNNGLLIKSRDRYEYKDEKTTKDCSLTINQFDYCKDNGNWNCQSAGNSLAEGVTSNNVEIEIPNECDRMQQDEAAYKARRSVDEEPKIVYNDNDITKMTLKYSPIVDDQLFELIKCKTELPTSKITWLIHGKPEFTGLKWSSSELGIDDELKYSIVDHFQNNYQVELICLVEYFNEDSHTATILFITENESELEPPAIRVPSNFATTIIIVIVVLIICIVLVLLSAVGVLIRYSSQLPETDTEKGISQDRKRASSESNESSSSCESADTTITYDNEVEKKSLV